jgi:ribonuclease HI
MNNAQDKLQVIIDLIEEYYLSQPDIFLSTKEFLDNILNVAQGRDFKLLPKLKELDHIIISCDALSVTNPEGFASIGCVIEFPKNHKLSRPPIEIAMKTKDTTTNLAEYTAISTGLLSLMNLFNNPGCEIEIRSNSQLAIKQLKNEIECIDEKLKAKRNGIWELLKQIYVPVKFIWRPKNSSLALQKANDMAQYLINI